MRQSTKKERSDKGTIRINSRDFRCLSWLLDMESAYEDDLSIVLNPTHRISAGAAKAVVRRWQQADLASAEALLANRGRIVRLTENGARLVGDVGRWVDGPVIGAVRTAEVSRLRLLLEGGATDLGVPVTGWITPHRWRLENERLVALGATAPDGVACLADGTSVAVRVERVNRGITRTRAIAVDLLSRFPRLIYAFPTVGDDVRPEIDLAVSQAGNILRARGGEPGRVDVIRIPERLAEPPDDVDVPEHRAAG